jgi:alkanesulfonate monooxygenase SsuD/methylene tetrahydromethanopterin reductase-like flavin-dependent oxidoreductase (luciferase family)
VAVAGGALPIPIGVNPTSIGVPAAWWLDVAALLEDAGFSALWCWDHFISRGRRTDPVLECWTTLTAAAAVTKRVRLGSFVTNALNREPAILARLTATLQDISGGRVVVGIGAGGHPAEHEAYGLPYPGPAERIARLEEAVRVLRALWTGGPVDFTGRFNQLQNAVAHPAPVPRPRVVVAGHGPRGARLAGRIGDAWTAPPPAVDAHRNAWLEGVAESGRDAAEVGLVVELALDRHTDPRRQPLLEDLSALAERWAERGATELVIANVRPEHIPALLAAAERAGLSA